MENMILSAGLFGLAVFCCACPESDETAPSGEVQCAGNCDRAVAANCVGTPPDFAAGCKMICSEVRRIGSECLEELDALSTCLAEEASFSCGESGQIVAGPQGACAAEFSACMDCTGELQRCITL